MQTSQVLFSSLIIFASIQLSIGQKYCSEKNVSDHFCLDDTFDDLKEPQESYMYARLNLDKVYEVNDFEETIEINVNFVLIWFHYRIVWSRNVTTAKWDLDRWNLGRIWSPKLLIENIMDFSIVEILSSSARLDLRYAPEWGST